MACANNPSSFLTLFFQWSSRFFFLNNLKADYFSDFRRKEILSVMGLVCHVGRQPASMSLLLSLKTLHFLLADVSKAVVSTCV